ncbi:MAG: autotransporter strand-loop-strand O-heptosyltransferase [Selenomonadaceae bacterium]|nr:autotransporter strand-loop-strand O-heptosyltransferase [Selenomonadaceae bacterium]
MKLHFFTVNDIEDYRKSYRFSTEGKKLIKESKARTKEDFDQEFFYHYIKNLLKVPEGIYESRIWGETGFPGLRLDFNFGLRLDIPEGNFRVKVSDFDTGQICFDKCISGGRLLSVEQYFIRWQVEVFLDEQKIFSHVLNFEGQPVTITFSTCPLLGDLLAFLPYLREFKKNHRCKLSICLNDKFAELVAQLYPDIPQIDKVNFQTYATYYPIMLQSPFPSVPVDTRQIPMNRIGGMLWGIDYLPPKAVFEPTAPPVTDEPYVCISVQASMNRKAWLYPGGWDVVIDYLKNLGYRVFCIDLNSEQTNDDLTIRKPEGAEDFTGNHPLLERANMLYHAEFFIGLGSGLTWVADAVGCPVVMICGFSQDWSEFYTPYRVANRKVCNGCFNDPRVSFVLEKCPFHKNTPRELECQKKISPRMVIDNIERLIVDKNLTPPALA